MKTKKILSFVLAAIMMFSMATISFAAETNTHELIYQNTASYEISIPSTSNIDIATGKGEIDVAVTNAKLEDWTVVAITASSPNYADGTWNLVNAKNSNDKISYTIGTTEGANDFVSGDRVVTASDVSESTLYVTVSDTSKVGTFTDIITFTSEITVEEITFNIHFEQAEEMNGEYKALKGMTWGDWVYSEYNTVGDIVIRDGGLEYPAGFSLYTGIAETYHSITVDMLIEDGNYYSFETWMDW